MKRKVIEMRRPEFDELVCSKYGMIKRSLAKYRLSNENVEDITQEIMTVVLVNIHTLKDLHKIDAWIASITQTCLKKFWKKEAKWQKLLSIWNFDERPLTDREVRDFCT